MISFLVTTKDEGNYISGLLKQITSIMSDNDEIVIVDDFSTDPITLEILDNYKSWYPKKISIYKHELNKNFAEHKNFGKDNCSKEWIFQLDADELMSSGLSNNIHTLLEYNEDVDLFLIPRINIVDGLTQEDINKWNWKVNEKGYVLWPDFQSRLFKNISRIKWYGKVHEIVGGAYQYSELPMEEDWAIVHHKEIKRQRYQNEFYKNI